MTDSAPPPELSDFSPLIFSPLIVLVTAPAGQSGELVNTILEARYAACVNIIPKISSHYHWQGKIESSSEDLLVIKTSRALFAKLEQCIKTHHPYDVPECVAIEPNEISDRYLDWWKSALNTR